MTTSKPATSTGTGTSALPVPNKVIASNGLSYQPNSKHTTGGAGNRPNAGIEPNNSLDLFNKSIPTTDPKVRLSIDSKGNIHRFFNDAKDGSGSFHWSSSTNDKVPLRYNVELGGYAREIRELRSGM